MGAHGSAYGRFRRALASGNATIAWAAAAELERVGLADALAVLLLQVDTEPERFDRAVVRLHARLCAEARGLTLREAQLALAALAALRGRGGSAAAHALSELLVIRGLNECADVLERWASERGQ